jgi:hypothetical protein
MVSDAKYARFSAATGKRKASTKKLFFVPEKQFKLHP